MMNEIIPSYETGQWLLILLSAALVGMAKAGIAGVGMIPIVLIADVVHGKASSGALLLMLIVGDAFAVRAFHKHAKWKYLKKILLPALIGIVIGWFLMGKIDDAIFRPVVGWIALGLAILHILRKRLGVWLESTYHSPIFAWVMGSMGGITTMIANAAGPVMTMFFMAMNLPKYEFVATGAWFFFIINLSKVPFSVQLGLISWKFCAVTVLMIPVVYLGIRLGRWLLHILPEKIFQALIILFTIIGAIKLILL